MSAPRIKQLFTADEIRDPRRHQLIQIFKFIGDADVDECARIIEEIRCCHNNICVWNRVTKSLRSVDSISINEGSVQLNVEG